MGLESLPTVERIEQPNNQLSNAQSLQEIHILISPNLGFYVAVRRSAFALERFLGGFFCSLHLEMHKSNAFRDRKSVV